jgi:hypothetical protein
VAEKGQHQSQKPPVPPNKSSKVNQKIIPKTLTSKKVGVSNRKGKGSGSSSQKRLPAPGAHQSPQLHVTLSMSTSSNTLSFARSINITEQVVQPTSLSFGEDNGNV